MEDTIDHSSEEFMNAKKEMDRLVMQSVSPRKAKPNMLFSKLSDLTKAVSGDMVKWSRQNSLWPLQFGLACCSIELMGFGSARIDAERKGYLLFRATPRQCDVMLVAGWVTKSMIPELKRMYEQMAKPRYVIAFGECATCGGPWWGELQYSARHRPGPSSRRICSWLSSETRESLRRANETPEKGGWCD